MTANLRLAGSLLLLLLASNVAVNSDCPKDCHCKWKGGKETVECVNASLNAIPESLGEGTQVLDLGFNYFPSLHADIFSSHNLRNLQKIYLSRCSLRNLQEHTFR